MGQIFNMDNKFFQFLNKAVDCVGLSVLWLLCCVPVVTAGAATTAMYYTVNKVIRHSRGYVWSEFWHAFRANFKQSTIAWLIVFAATIFMAMDCYIMYQFAKAGESIGKMFVVFVVFIALILIWGIYLFPYIARFENVTKAVLKNAGLIAIANLPWTLLLFVLYLISVFVAWLIPPTIMLVPGVYMVLANLVLERVFRKYMTEEDLAAEEERNREYFN